MSITLNGCDGELWAVGPPEELFDLIAILRAQGFKVGVGENHDEPAYRHADVLLVPGIPPTVAEHEEMLREYPALRAFARDGDEEEERRNAMLVASSRRAKDALVEAIKAKPDHPGLLQ